jgi:hypothetical protein
MVLIGYRGVLFFSRTKKTNFFVFIVVEDQANQKKMKPETRPENPTDRKYYFLYLLHPKTWF